jgi:hypothetical protein
MRTKTLNAVRSGLFSGVFCLSLLACSGSGGNGPANHGADPKAQGGHISDDLMGKMNKAQAYNQDAVAYMQTQNLKGDQVLPDMDLAFMDPIEAAKSPKYAKLNAEGRQWLTKIVQNCAPKKTHTDPQLSKSAPPVHVSVDTETLSGDNCPVSYSSVQTVRSEMEPNADNHIIKGTGKSDFSTVLSVKDPDLRNSSGVYTVEIKATGSTNYDAVFDAQGAMKSGAIHAVISGSAKIESSQGVVSAGIDLEMVINPSGIEMAMYAELTTPKGQLTVSFYTANGKTEIKIGGHASTEDDLSHVFGTVGGIPTRR